MSERKPFLPVDLFMEKPQIPSQPLRPVEAALRVDGSQKAAVTHKHTKKPHLHNIILCVDPDSSKTAEYGRIFAEGGWEVEAVPTLKEAVSRMKQVKFDCIVIDVDLPDMAGYDAVPVMKTIDPGANIVVTVGSNTKELETRVRNEDIFYYYIKSFDVEELKLAVRSAITAAHKRD
jgi:DNA-binding NtrC family response regulator